jgi:hypothetical protein
VANEYIFAIGAHVLYWGSKDLCNFILKHTVHRDAHDAEAWAAMVAANGLQQSSQGQQVRRGSGGVRLAEAAVAVGGGGEGKGKGKGDEMIPEAVRISLAS